MIAIDVRDAALEKEKENTTTVTPSNGNPYIATIGPTNGSIHTAITTYNTSKEEEKALNDNMEKDPPKRPVLRIRRAKH